MNVEGEMMLFRPRRLMKLHHKITVRRANVKKQFLSIDANETAKFCYYEKGFKVAQRPSIVFIHGFSSNKSAWLSIIKDIPDGVHCIAIDMPGHGESIGFDEEDYVAVKIIDQLKVFFDKLNLIEPMCFVGGSMGGSIVAMFAMKYPSYVSMICMLAPPPPGEDFETDIMRELRLGKHHIILPETVEQVYAAADTFSTKKIPFRRLLARGFLKSRLSDLDEHRKVLRSALENDYPYLKQNYEKLRNLTCPALIVWGRQDKLCDVEGARYFVDLIPDAELIVFNNYGHLISIDQPKATADSIGEFWKTHRDFQTLL